MGWLAGICLYAPLSEKKRTGNRENAQCKRRLPFAGWKAAHMAI